MRRPGQISLNAAATWGRGALAVFLGFFSSRWLLEVLGAEGYGLWVLVCGMAALAALVHGVISSSTARFLAVAVGRDDVASWYPVIARLHCIVAGMTVIVGLPVCLWIVLGDGMSVPGARQAEVMVVLCVVFTKSLIAMINVPNRQLFIAHQRMVELAIWGSIDVVVNFVILAWMVVNPGRYFIAYAAILSGAAVLVEIMLWLRTRYVFAVKSNDDEKMRDKMWEIFRFAGFRFLSDGGSILGVQGMTILVNAFLGPVSTASLGIARTVSTHCGSLAESVAQAYEPALANVANSRDKVRTMAYSACLRLIVSYLTFAVPLALLIDPVLRFWLKEVPQQTASAVLWLLAIGFLDAAGRSFYCAVTAIGRVKVLYTGVGILHGLALPLAVGALVFRPRLEINAALGSVFTMHFISLMWTIGVFYVQTRCKADRI